MNGWRQQLPEQRLRFVELARQLAAESKATAQRNGWQNALPVWVPATNLKMHVFDGRDNVTGLGTSGAKAKNVARLYGVSELDLCVVDLTPSLADPRNVAVRVCLALEIKYSACDLIKAFNQEVVFAKNLAEHAHWTRLRQQQLFNEQQMQRQQQQQQAATTPSATKLPPPPPPSIPQFFRAYARVPDDDYAFATEFVPEMPASFAGGPPHAIAAVSKQLLQIVDAPPVVRNAAGAFFITIDSFAEWAEEERRRYHPDRVLLPPSPASLAAASPNSPPPNATTIPLPPPPSLRFYLVSRWHSNEDAAKYFPVFAALKHAVIRNLASLFAAGDWCGVAPPSEEVLKLVDQRVNELPRVSNNSTNFSILVSPLFLEQATRVAAHGMFHPRSADKKSERRALYAPLGTKLQALAKDLSLSEPQLISGQELLGHVSHHDFVVAVASISRMWDKLASKKEFKAPGAFWRDYVARDNVMFVRFPKKDS